MQSCVNAVSYSRLHRMSDASALLSSCVVVWQIIVVRKLFVVFWDESVNYLYDDNNKNKNKQLNADYKYFRTASYLIKPVEKYCLV